MKRTGADAPKTVEDLVRITGLGKDLVRAGIRSGELPGVVVGSRYVIPQEAFDRFCRGEWVPIHHTVLTAPAKALPQPSDFLKRRSEDAA